jgi:hypothetical protein
MEKGFQKLAGYCLMFGSLLMVLTMVLHPTGGDIEHILKIANIGIISHSIGILSVPFTAFGFWGLAHRLQTSNRFSFLAFGFISFGLVAIMLAAAINGLVLPMYVIKQQHRIGQNLEAVKLIINYNTTFNAAMDYIFIAGYAIAMFIWSIIIIKTRLLPRWMGFLGLVLLICTMVAVFLQLNFISVRGFTIYVLGMVSWLISCGWHMAKGKL